MGGMAAPPGRRRFRFGLRAMFVAVTLLAIWLGWNVHQVRNREKMRLYIVSQGGVIGNGTPVRPWKTLPWTWSILGAEPVATIDLTAVEFSDDDVRHIEPWFPEADISTSRSGGMGGGTGGMGGGMF
jgi:hypothetical protein